MHEEFARWLSAHDAAATPMSRCLRGPIDDASLARIEATVSVVPVDVVALHRIADGVDSARWGAAADEPPHLVPDGPEFADLAGARAAATRMRAAAEQTARVMGEDPDELWPSQLGLAYPTWPDECIAVDTEVSPGTLWLVRWQAADIRQLEHGLDSLFDAATQRFVRLNCRWNAQLRILEFDEDLADELPLFPD